MDRCSADHIEQTLVDIATAALVLFFVGFTIRSREDLNPLLRDAIITSALVGLGIVLIVAGIIDFYIQNWRCGFDIPWAWQVYAIVFAAVAAVVLARAVVEYADTRT